MNTFMLPTLILISLFLFEVGCKGRNTQLDNSQIVEIQRHSKINFPASTKWVNLHLDRGMEYFFAGVFIVNKSELPLLLPRPTEWSSSRRCMTNEDYKASWFNPDSVKSYKSIEINYPNSNSDLKILYGENNDKVITVTVYIIWFETS